MNIYPYIAITFTFQGSKTRLFKYLGYICSLTNNNKLKSLRIAHEKQVVELMIRLYCRKKEKNQTLCPDCEALLYYAHTRLNRCPFGEKKGACKDCKIHCYQPAMRERMRQVMRFSGPRMLIYAPWEAIKHLLRK